MVGTAEFDCGVLNLILAELNAQYWGQSNLFTGEDKTWTTSLDQVHGPPIFHP